MTEATITRLPNGLRVATLRMPQVETAAVAAWVDVGARYESAEENGLAHFVEHMMFKGTPTRTALQIAEEFDAVGGHLNAFTSREHTVYHAKVLKEHLPTAMDLIADIVFNATIDPEELERERGVILQEIAQSEDDPDDMVFDFAQTLAYPGQALGRPILGTSDLIKSYSRDEMLHYLQHHYFPENMALSVAGNVTHEQVVALAERYFKGKENRGSSAHLAAEYAGGEKIVKRDLEQVHLVLGFKGISLHSDDYFAMQMLSVILGGGMSSRLFQEVREKRGLCYAIQPYSSYYSDGGLFNIFAGTAADKAEELLFVVADEVRKITASVRDEEIARARAQLKASIFMDKESTVSQAEDLGRQILCFQRQITAEEMVRDIEAVTGADIMRVAKSLLDEKPSLAAIGNVGSVPSLDTLRNKLLI